MRRVRSRIYRKAAPGAGLDANKTDVMFLPSSAALRKAQQGEYGRVGGGAPPLCRG